jgi:phage-related protein
MTDYSTPTFGWQVDYTSHGASKPRTLTAAFGDGYEQRTGDGINTNPKSRPFTITRDTATINTIEALLDAWAGVTSFFYLAPNNKIGRYVCRQYDVQYGDFNKSTLTGTFDQVFMGAVPVFNGGVLGDSGLME